MEPKRILDPKFPYTKSSDIYSYGVLMWEISSGYPPFKDIVRNNNMISVAIAINKGTREVTIPGTPKDYEELFKKCWCQEPEQRPTIEVVLEEFSKMGFGINVKVKGILINILIFYIILYYSYIHINSINLFKSSKIIKIMKRF